MSTKKKIIFIVNPISGNGKHKLAFDKLDFTLLPDTFLYEVEYTTLIRDADTIVAERKNETVHAFIAVGGDGTVNKVAKNLIGTGVALGIIPGGSGNGIARHLGIPLGINKALKVITNHSVAPMDTGIINDHSFIGFAGIGFDAYVAHLFNQGKKRGLLRYIRLSLIAYFNYHNKEYTLTIDGKTVKKKAFLIACANINQFGNNAYIAPKANCFDGFLDICILKKPSIVSSFTFVRQLFTQRLNKNSNLEILKATSLSCDMPIEIANVDGEAVIINSSFNIQIKPKSLNILIPN